MSNTDIDDDITSDEDSPGILSWLQDNEQVPVPAGDARRRLERYWELKRLRQEVDDFAGADMDWDDL
jgi:hypothetical protein